MPYMSNIKKNTCIFIVCCCLNGVCNANSWDQFISPLSPEQIKVPKVVKFPKVKKNAPQGNFRETETTELLDKKQPNTPKDENVSAEKSDSLEYPYFDKAFSQWFDNDIRPQFYLRGGFVEETKFGKYGETEMATLDFKVRVYDAVDFLPGAALDVWVFGEGLHFLDNLDIPKFPDTLVSTGVNVGLWWRFANGFSWEFRSSPGIYSDISSPDFSYTGTVNLHYTFSEELCLLVGVTYRPDWDIEFFPQAGFLWQPNDAIRMLIAIPETRIDLLPRHIINLYGTLSWDNTTYWLDSDNVLPETMTFDAVRASVGATMILFNNYEFSAEFGTHLHHELKGGVMGEETIELDKTTFIRASIGSRF